MLLKKTQVDHTEGRYSVRAHTGCAPDNREDGGDGRYLVLAIPRTRIRAAIFMSTPAVRFPMEDAREVANALSEPAAPIAQDLGIVRFPLGGGFGHCMANHGLPHDGFLPEAIGGHRHELIGREVLGARLPKDASPVPIIRPLVKVGQ